MRWPIREALLALVAWKQAEALEEYRFEVVTWTIGAAMGGAKKGSAPKWPAILR